jgi:phage tape measure protein|uniref:Tail length tape measure protein n=1 Tax=Siphoviridae sp. ctTic26 TaxID=2823583 RepID=A0A8S5LEL6_9CAUD|nr:MAG TPA: tail length tape measure protein [Siphoviridae sp. ctTic26]
MATIQNSIVLNDRMTQTFTAINRAIESTINAISTLGGKNVNINTANLISARQQLAIAENEMQNMVGTSQQLNNNLSKTKGIVGEIVGKLKTAFGLAAVVMATKKTIELSDQNAQITARLNLVSDAPEQLKKQIYQSANDARVAYTDSMNQVAKLGLLAKDSFNNTNEIVKFTNLMNKAFKVSGTGAQEATSAMYQLTQAMAAGKLQGDEFRSVMENAPMVAQAIAKYMNVPLGQLKELGAKGQITADIIKNALFSASDEINEKFKTLPLTWQDVWVQAKNFAIKQLDGVLQKVNQVANSKAFRSFVNSAKIAFFGLKTVAEGVFNGIAAAGKFIADNWTAISPVIWGVTAALITYVTWQGISVAIEWINVAAKFALNLAVTILTMAKIALTFAVKGYTAAQTMANATAWMFPGTWLAAIIIGVIVAILALAVAIVQWATGTQSALETIGGMFYWLGAAIYNIGVAIMNILIIVATVVILAFILVGTTVANVFIGIWNVGVWLVNILVQAWYWLVNHAAMAWAWLKVTVSNILKGIYNFFVEIANGFIKGYNKLGKGAVDTANGFQDAFFSAINAVAKFAQDFINGFLKGLAEIGKVIDSVAGTHFGNAGSVNFSINKGDRATWKDVGLLEKKSYGDPNGVAVEQKQAPQFDYAGFIDPSGAMKGVMDGAEKLANGEFKDLGKAFDDGKSDTRKGIQGITDTFNEYKDKLTGKDKPVGNDGTGKDKKNGGGGKDPNNKKTADNTKKMADKMDGMDEDMKYLRDIAEKEYVNKFTTAEVKIDMTNYNDISEQVDAEDFMDRLGERIAEHVHTAAEGVHDD